MSRRRMILLAAVFPVLMQVYLYLMYSHKASYDRIALGQSLEEVGRAFPVESVICGDNRFAPQVYSKGNFACFFRDPWREYRLGFHDGRVGSKSMIHLRPLPLLLRIIRRIRD